MIKAELIEALSNEAGLTTSKAKEVVRVFFDEISNALTKGVRVEIRGFGTFKVKSYDGHTGHNPKTANLSRLRPRSYHSSNAARTSKREWIPTDKKTKEQMMKKLKKDMKAVAKDLKGLTQKIEKMIKRLEKLEKKAQAAKKPKAKAVKKAVAKKPAKLSASGTVLAIVKRSRKGVDTATLKKKTDFEGRKIRDITYRLKKQGKIKGERKGLYVKA